MNTPNLLAQLDQLALEPLLSSKKSCDIANDAFKDAVHICSTNFPPDEVQAWMNNKVGSTDLLKEVNKARTMYQDRRHCKARKWLTRLSARITLYGSVLDVLAQHHPEYVALAWGSIKFVVIGVMNHEDLTKELAKALCRIGDVLPQAELTLLVYPTVAMKELVTTLYVQIIKFVRRARKWYNECRLKHVISAIARPFSLRFQDMVDNISEISRRVERLALTLSMAELRKTRLELESSRREQKTAHSIALETNQKLDLYHTIQHEGLVDTNRRVCEIQFSQLMTFANTSLLSSPEVCRTYFTTRRNRNRRKGLDNCSSFRNMPQLLSWGSATESTQLAICGGFSHRQAVRDFSIDAIELIAEAQIPVIWALHLPQSRSEFAFADVVKYLIGQVVQRNHTLLNERSASLNVARFQSAVTTDEWFSLLGAVLEGLPQVFFILDLEFMGQEGIGKLAWTDLFTRLFEDLRKRGSQIILKVLFLGFRSSHRARLSNFDQNKVLRLQTTRHCRISKTQDKFHSRKLSKNRGRALKSSYLGFDSGDKLEKIKR